MERHRFPSNGLKALDGGRNARPNGVFAPVEVEAVTAGETAPFPSPAHAAMVLATNNRKEPKPTGWQWAGGGLFLSATQEQQVDIENLTIKQVREVTALCGGGNSNIDAGNPFVGKHCVFRGRMFGVYFGLYERTVVIGKVTYAIVRNARRIQYQSYNGFTLSSVATEGLAGDSTLSPPVDTHGLQLSDGTGDGCEIFVVADDIADDIKGMKNG